jgi:hypothetical protein
MRNSQPPPLQPPQLRLQPPDLRLVPGDGLLRAPDRVGAELGGLLGREGAEGLAVSAGVRGLRVQWFGHRRVEMEKIEWATGIPDGWQKVQGFGGYTSDGNVTAVFTDGRQVVLLGEPSEESGHNCDTMGCGWDHVLCRISEQVPTSP